MNIDAVKEYLESYTAIKWEIDDLELEAAELQEKIESMFGAKLTGVQGSKEPNKDKVPDYIIALNQLCTYIDREYINLIGQRFQIRRFIDELPKNEQAVIIKRYIHDKPYGTIGREMRFSEARIFQIHRDALERLADMHGNTNVKSV